MTVTHLVPDPQCPAPTFPRLFSFRAPPPVDITVATAGAFGPKYLVQLNGASDDVPLGLFEEREEAVEFAREVRDNPEGHAERYFSLLGFEGSRWPHWLSVSVVEFEGPIPTARTVLFHLD